MNNAWLEVKGKNLSKHHLLVLKMISQCSPLIPFIMCFMKKICETLTYSSLFK